MEDINDGQKVQRLAAGRHWRSPVPNRSAASISSGRKLTQRKTAVPHSNSVPERWRRAVQSFWMVVKIADGTGDRLSTREN